MGSTISSKPSSDLCGPMITDDEIKKLTFVGFTKEELRQMDIGSHEYTKWSKASITKKHTSAKKD